jgi:hypothetical protein
MFVWTWGTLNAHSDGDFDAMLPDWRCTHYRNNLSVCALLSLMPPMWVISPFLTGFYKYGWRLKPAPECRK